MQASSPEKMQLDFFVTEGRAKEGVYIPTLCHGDGVVWMHDGTEDIRSCDALITGQRHLKLGVTTADCASVSFGDGTQIAIAHVGWRGLCLGLIEKVLKEFDSNTVEIFVGPHLHTFEIQKDACYETIKDACGEDFFTHKDGKVFFEFRRAIASRLPANTFFDDRDTAVDMSLPSHRRDKTTKRLITVVSFIPLEST